MSPFGALWADLRFAARTLLRHPGYTLVAVATLAIGIAANAIIFSVTRPILLSPLPFHQPESLMRVVADNQAANVLGAGMSVGDFRDYRRLATTLRGLSAFTTARNMALSGDDRPESVRGSLISPSTFDLLQVQPALGRGFVAAEETLGRDRVALLSDGFWHRRFGGKAAVLHQTIQLGGVGYQVIGVMKPDFRYPVDGIDLWLPLAFDAADNSRESRYLHGLARLAPGVGVEQANAELSRIATLLAREHDADGPWTARAAPFAEHLARRVRPALLMLSAAVGFLLLIACSNLANLLLARGTSRSRETAIRAAVGAQARSLVRLFLVESLLLSVIGCALAIPLAMVGVDLLLANGPDVLPRISTIEVNSSVILFALLLAIVSAFIFGLVPALQLAHPNLAESSREGEGVGGRRGGFFRAFLVMAEVALALVLLTSASLLFRGFLKLSEVAPGFDPRQALALQINLPTTRYPDDASQVAFFNRLVADLASLPGVRSVAVATTLPLAKTGQNLQPVGIEGGGAAAEDLKGVVAAFSAVGPGFFQTLHIPLVAGREFAATDVTGAPYVAVISQELAKRAFPSQNPLGKNVILGVQGSTPLSFRVVGVVRGVRQLSLADSSQLTLYTPLAQVAYPNAFVVLRTDRDPLGLAQSAEKRVLAIDPAQPVTRSLTLDQLLVEDGAQSRFFTGLLSLFAGIGLLLSCVGLYGVIAYNVSRRKHEFAVRMAVGASKQDILWMVIGAGLKLSAAGVLVGLLGSFLLTGLLKSLLFGLGPRDPSSFVLAPAILLLVAGLACYLPARRALRVDPVSPLRQV